MKKSNIIFLLVVQLVLLFIFSNIYTLFKPLEKKETEAITEKSDLLAELLVRKYPGNIEKIKNAAYFNQVKAIDAGKPSRSSTVIDEVQVYTIVLPFPEGQGAVEFKKAVTSLTLTMLKRLNKTFSNLSIFLGVFLILTTFYLMFLYKKEKSVESPGDIPPLHDYLLELKGSELELKGIVKRQQESVLRQDELNKSIINNINAAIIFLDETGRIEIFNPVAEKLFSQSSTHARHNLPEKILPAFPGLSRFIAGHKGKTISAELETGEKVFLVDRLPMEKIGTLIIIKDITDEKKRENIDRRNKNFIMLGEMTAYLAHEIRNSLGTIFGYTRTIEEGIREEEKNNLGQKIGRVNREIHFLSTMMETFLNFSRPVQVEKREAIDLGDLVSRLAAEIGLEIQVSGSGITLENDRTLIKSVFFNLLLNSKEAGARSVSVHIDKREHLEIIFTDNGRGIDPQIEDRIWYPFFTTREKGTGMGLAIIRKIVNSLNGEIILEKSGPQGTTFKIVFYG